MLGIISVCVLNACRRQRSVHAKHARGHRTAKKCSTPVGVKDRFTRKHSSCASMAKMCSTPVGVKDRFTPSSPPAWRSGPRAQRLSASKIGSHGGQVPDGTGIDRCSTPVGVKDRFTVSRRGPRPWPSCAQRLSASKIGSLVCHRLADLLRGVLNACRRQRSVHGFDRFDDDVPLVCSTPVGVKDRFTCPAE